MKYIIFIAISLNLLCTNASALDLVQCPNTVKQGKTLPVVVGSVSADIRCTLFNKEFKFYPDGSNFKAIIGIDVQQKPGKYVLNITYIGINGSEESLAQNVTVLKTVFPSSRVKLSKTKMALLNDGLLEQDIKKLSSAFSFESDSQYWTGRFAVPLRYKYVTTKFGYHRIYNNLGFGYHRGIDYAAPSGSFVKAANAGYVVLSEYLPVHGNTIVIDHGYGIKTIYCHLDKRTVKVGNFIAKNMVIGAVGNTGLSSGPHLHFGLSVHDVRVDPTEWLNTMI